MQTLLGRGSIARALPQAVPRHHPAAIPQERSTPTVNDLIVSRLPGRLRLRNTLLRRSPLLAQLRDASLLLPGMHAARSNPRVGSLLLQYDPLRLSDAEIDAWLTPLLQPLRGVVPEGAPKGGSRNGWARAAGSADPAVTSPVDEPRVIAPDERAFVKQAPAGGTGSVPKAMQRSVLPRPGRGEGPLRRRRHGRALGPRFNRLSKRGMLLSLGTSLGLAAAGAKRGHIYSGGAFVVLLASHLWTHRKSLWR